MKKLASGVTTIYDYDVAGNLISESEADGTPLRDIVYMNGERIAMRLYGSQAGWYFFINDHLGTPQKVVDSSGVVVWQAAYLPFGKAQVLAGSSITNNFRFPGQYYDAETELHQNWHRYQMPGKGRYLTPDPIGLAGGINLYAYVAGNPTNLSDPFGLYESPWYLQWVPGQHFYDLGMTALENGEYGAAAAYFSGMVSEQILFFATLGEGSSVRVSSQCTTVSKAAKSGFETILDEGGSKLIEVTTKNGNKLEVMFDEVVDGSRLILRKTHIDGAKPGEIGIKQLKERVRQYGKERGFKQVIVEGGKRSTGRMKGKTPRPMVIDIE